MSAGELLTDPTRLAALATVLPAALANPEAMDRLAGLAATVMDAPVGLVNLIGDRHQYLVGLVGLGEPYASGRRLSVEFGYCPCTTLAGGEPVYIEDAAEDPAFVEHSAHLELGFVAYAGVPLRDADGQLLGTLCVTDSRAHGTVNLSAVRRVWVCGDPMSPGEGLPAVPVHAAAATPLASFHTVNRSATAALHSAPDIRCRPGCRKCEEITPWAEQNRCTWPAEWKRFITFSRTRVG